MSSDSKWTEDYAALCSSYPFSVTWGPNGKELRASQPIAAGQTFLMEAPLLAWPVKASAAFGTFSFCENCLRIRPFQPHNEQHKHKQRHVLSQPAPPASAEAASQPAEETSEHAATAAPAATTAAGAASPEEEEDQLGICVRDTHGKGALWFCSPRCYHQAWGPSKRGGAEAGQPSDTAAVAHTTARSKRDVDGSLISPNTNSSSSTNGSSSKLEEQSECGWMEFLSLEALLRLRHYDEQQRVAADWEARVNGGDLRAVQTTTNAGGATDTAAVNGKDAETNKERVNATREEANNENPIGVEALGRAVARVAATATSLRNTFDLDIECAYAEACRPFLRLSAATSAEVISAFDLQGAQQLLQQLLGPPITDALGSEVAETLLGGNALAFLYGGLMRNAQSLLLWGAAADGSLMLLRGAGVYVLQACCNHSCSPNCSVQNEQDAFIALKADKDIQVGEEITITYVPLDLPASQRQQLLNSYQFTCTCSRCANEMQQQSQQQLQQQ